MKTDRRSISPNDLGNFLSSLLRLVVAVVILAVHATAQRPNGPEDIRGPEGSLISYDAVVLPGPSADTFVVDIHYRIQQSFFVYLQTAAGGAQAQGELLVELIGKNGAATAREVRSIQLNRASQPSTGEVLNDLQDQVRFSLPAGTYTIVMEVRAFESERRFLERRRTLEIGTTAGAQLLPRPMFGFLDQATGVFVPFNRGGGSRYGSFGGMVVHFRTTTSPIGILSWRIRGVSDGDRSTRAEYLGIDSVTRGQVYAPVRAEDRLQYRQTPSSSWGSAYVSLPLERLEPGPYTIEATLTAGEDKISHTYRLMVVWPDRPISLTSIDLAVDALRHIADPEEIDDMIGFFADGGTERFQEFWRRFDNDSTTAYNPAQEEYYRRVDDAIRKFSTRGGTDGYKTDRGRVLILFGSPTTSQRIFKPNTGPREIWVYKQLKKRFIFTDPDRTGNYTLSQTEDL